MSTHKTIFSFPFSIRNLPQTIAHISNLALMRQSAYVCVANVHMLVEAKKDPNFAPVLAQADMSVLDGMPLCWSMKWLRNIKAERIAGMHLMDALLKEGQANPKLSFYIYGSINQVLLSAEHFINTNYPGIKLVGLHSPPFRMLTAQEEAKVIQNIKDSGANIVFVALGCPKQEKWMAKMRGKIPAVMLGIGVALEVLTLQQTRTPLWMERAGLEWLFRLYKEPRRLLKRYFVTNTYFIIMLVKYFLKSKK